MNFDLTVYTNTPNVLTVTVTPPQPLDNPRAQVRDKPGGELWFEFDIAAEPSTSTLTLTTPQTALTPDLCDKVGYFDLVTDNVPTPLLRGRVKVVQGVTN